LRLTRRRRCERTRLFEQIDIVAVDERHRIMHQQLVTRERLLRLLEWIDENRGMNRRKAAGRVGRGALVLRVAPPLRPVLRVKCGGEEEQGEGKKSGHRGGLYEGRAIFRHS